MIQRLPADSAITLLHNRLRHNRLCNEAYKKPKVLTCLHVFCTECLEELFERQNNHGCRFTTYY